MKKFLTAAVWIVILSSIPYAAYLLFSDCDKPQAPEITQETAVYPVEPDIVYVPDEKRYDIADITVYIREQCKTAGVNYSFALSVLLEENPVFFDLAENPALQESVFEAVNRNMNKSVDYGLWQLNGNYLWEDFVPRYWHGRGDFDWKNPYHNTYIAIRHIRWLYDTIQKYHIEQGKPQLPNSIYWETAMAYNAGLTKIRGKIPPETVEYAFRVLGRVYS